MKKGWLSSIWKRATGGHYVTIGTLTADVCWRDTGGKDHVTFMLQENLNGKRRTKSTYSSNLFKPEESSAYHNEIVPWEQGLIETVDIGRLVTDPDIYEKLDYKQLGSINVNSEHEGTSIAIAYYFYENDNGNRRVTKNCDFSPFMSLPYLKPYYADWIKGKIETSDLPQFTFANNKPPEPDKVKEAVVEKKGNVFYGNFRKPNDNHPK